MPAGASARSIALLGQRFGLSIKQRFENKRRCVPRTLWPSVGLPGFPLAKCPACFLPVLAGGISLPPSVNRAA
jgi:hypothetical protein